MGTSRYVCYGSQSTTSGGVAGLSPHLTSLELSLTDSNPGGSACLLPQQGGDMHGNRPDSLSPPTPLPACKASTFSTVNSQLLELFTVCGCCGCQVRGGLVEFSSPPQRESPDPAHLKSWVDPTLGQRTTCTDEFYSTM